MRLEIPLTLANLVSNISHQSIRVPIDDHLELIQGPTHGLAQGQEETIPTSLKPIMTL